MSAVAREPASRLDCSSYVTPNRALLIAEVLEIILDELVNDKRSISHLAFTCKAIAEPSLDRLWALNDSLEPFVYLLPDELTLNVCSNVLIRRDLMSCSLTGQLYLPI